MARLPVLSDELIISWYSKCSFDGIEMTIVIQQLDLKELEDLRIVYMLILE